MVFTFDPNANLLNLGLGQDNEKNPQEIDSLALEIKMMKEQLENSKTPRNKH